MRAFALVNWVFNALYVIMVMFICVLHIRDEEPPPVNLLFGMIAGIAMVIWGLFVLW